MSDRRFDHPLVKYTARLSRIYAALGVHSPRAGELDPLSQLIPRDLGGRLCAGDTLVSGRPAVDVVVRVNGTAAQTRACIRSMLERTRRPFHLVVVDDTSNRFASRVVRQFAGIHPKVRLLSGDALPDWGTALALALRECQGEWVVALDSSVELCDSWLELLLATGSEPGANPAAVPLEYRQVLEADAPAWLPASALALAVRRLAAGTRMAEAVTHTECLAFRREAVADLGGADVRSLAAFATLLTDGTSGPAVVDEVVVRSAEAPPGAQPSDGAAVALQRLRAVLADAMSNPLHFSESLRRSPDDPVGVAFVAGGATALDADRLAYLGRLSDELVRLGVPARLIVPEAITAEPRQLAESVRVISETETLESLTEGFQVLCASDAASAEWVGDLTSGSEVVVPAFFADALPGLDLVDDDSARWTTPAAVLDDPLVLVESDFLCGALTAAGIQARAIAPMAPPAGHSAEANASCALRVLVDGSVSGDGTRPRVAAAVADRLGQISGIEVRLARDGAVDQSALAWADVFVDARAFQAHPRRMLQALAGAAVPIMSRFGCAGEYLVDGVSCVLVDAFSIEAFIAEVVFLLHNRSILTWMAQQGQSSLASLTRERAALDVQAALTVSWHDRCRPAADHAQPVIAQHAGPVVALVASGGDADGLHRTLESVEAHTSDGYRLIVLDAATDGAVRTELARYQREHDHVAIVRCSGPSDVAWAVNAAWQAAGQEDLALLALGTEVTPNWLGKLKDAAATRPNVATVTPLSTALLTDESDWSAAQLNELVELVSTKVRPTREVSDPACMYLTRDALHLAGQLDTSHPTLTDAVEAFCKRCRAVGLAHLTDDAAVCGFTSALPSPAAESVVADSAVAEVWATVQSILQEGPEWLSSPAAALTRVLLVTHAGDDGAVATTMDLARSISNQFDVTVLRCGVDEWTLERVNSRLTEIERMTFSESWSGVGALDDQRLDALSQLCVEQGVELVHFTSLLGTGPDAVARLKQDEVPVVLSLYDFHVICPTGTLIDDHRVFCAGRCTPGSGQCVVPERWFGHTVPPLKHRFVHEWQARTSRMLQSCEAVVVPSVSATRIIGERFDSVTDQLRIIEPGLDAGAGSSVAVRPKPDARPRVVAFGALNWQKGAALLDAVMRLDLASGPVFEWHLIGRLDPGWSLDGTGAIAHGPYTRETLSGVLADLAPSYAIVAPLWPEPLCHVLSEAWMHGIPAFTSSLDGLEERVEVGGGGWVLPHNDPAAWYERMLAVQGDLSEWDARHAELNMRSFRNADDMAREHRALYREILAARGARHSGSGLGTTS